VWYAVGVTPDFVHYKTKTSVPASFCAAEWQSVLGFCIFPHAGQQANGAFVLIFIF